MVEVVDTDDLRAGVKAATARGWRYVRIPITSMNRLYRHVDKQAQELQRFREMYYCSSCAAMLHEEGLEVEVNQETDA